MIVAGPNLPGHVEHLQGHFGEYQRCRVDAWRNSAEAVAVEEHARRENGNTQTHLDMGAESRRFSCGKNSTVGLIV